MKKTIIKGATLVLFISLVGSFVLYRAGVFGERTTSYSMSPNGSVINSSTDETESTTDSITKKPTIISSSKVMIINDPILPGENTTETVSQKDTTKAFSLADYIRKNKEKSIISSSKSSQVFTEQDLVKLVKDSLRADSLKNKGNE